MSARSLDPSASGAGSAVGSASASTGRANQRRRTRQAILAAAAGLLDDGRTPTVAEAADAAAVSRATAYRYFQSQEDLLFECALRASFPSPAELFARPDAPQDVEDRVVFVQAFLYAWIRQREAFFRQFLRHSLQLAVQDDVDDRILRPGYRVRMLEHALEPLAAELGPDRLRRLVSSLTVLVGTEAVIVARDVLHADDETAVADAGWACRQLVRAARAEAAGA